MHKLASNFETLLVHSVTEKLKKLMVTYIVLNDCNWWIPIPLK